MQPEELSEYVPLASETVSLVIFCEFLIAEVEASIEGGIFARLAEQPARLAGAGHFDWARHQVSDAAQEVCWQVAEAQGVVRHVWEWRRCRESVRKPGADAPTALREPRTCRARRAD